jgi:hypothetical protein
MAKKAKTSRKSVKKEPVEKDSVYFLKLVLFFILGTLWVQFGDANGLALPVGLIFGVLLANHDHFAIDKKIEYAVLLVAAILSYVVPIGFILSV